MSEQLTLVDDVIVSEPVIRESPSAALTLEDMDMGEIRYFDKSYRLMFHTLASRLRQNKESPYHCDVRSQADNDLISVYKKENETITDRI